MRDNGFNVNVIDTSDDIYGMTPTGVSDCRKFKWSPSSEVWDSNTMISVSAIYFQNLCAIKISSGLSSEYETDMKRRESSCRHVWEDHDDGSKWKHFPRYWPFVQGPPVNSPQKGQWHGALIYSLICVWINGWVNNWCAVWYNITELKMIQI